MLHQGILTGAVPGVHPPYLGHSHVGLINNHDKIPGEVVQQGIGRLTGLPPRKMAGVILDAAAKAHLLHHFHIVTGPLFQALGLQQFFPGAQFGQAFLQLSLNGQQGPFHLGPGSGVVAGWKNRYVAAYTQDLSGKGVKFQHFFHHVAVKIHPDCLFRGGSRKDFQHVPPHPEFAPGKIHLVALVLDVHQLAQDSVPVVTLPLAQGQDQGAVFLRVPQTINAGNAGYNNYVPAFEEGGGGRVAQLIYFIVNR
ncbi:MAG: hypothetical protein BWY80_01107 [Firmicutes bacterium ADurb.Bin456]|nr:MAG: hypothetical protein BWY80_01107 [Firmicutes bacterium ADurb.Bin456]